jgi:hypothetical protein
MLYKGIDANHPRMLEAIKTMVKLGKPRKEIMDTLGTPSEVVERIEREVKDRDRKA